MTLPQSTGLIVVQFGDRHGGGRPRRPGVRRAVEPLNAELNTLTDVSGRRASQVHRCGRC
jgi:hypothetical protein